MKITFLHILHYVLLQSLQSIVYGFDGNENLERFTSKVHQYMYNETNPSTLLWSPVSVYSALLTFLDGADNTTLSELEELLGTKKIKSLRSRFNESNLKLATGLFVHQELKMRDEFMQDFSKHSRNKSVQRFNNLTELTGDINEWMKNKTDGLIDKIIDGVDSSAKLVVVNGIAFRGKWKTQFLKQRTLRKLFHGLNTISEVELMVQKSVQDHGQFQTDENEGFEVLKMGYKDSKMKILFVLPDRTENLGKVFTYLSDVGKLGEIAERLEPTELEIGIPKLSVRSHVIIKNALDKAGVKALFSPIASNLSRMFENSNNYSLHVDNFVHETVIELDEEGTKAGAGTAAFLIPLSGLNTKNFTLDRPFLIFLRWEGKLTFFEGAVTDLKYFNGNKTEVLDLGTGTNGTQDAKSNSTETTDTTAGLEVVQRGNPSGDGWWIHKGPPEYLKDENKTDETEMKTNKTDFKAKSSATFARFQQPEPKDPEGIRFPNPAKNIV